MYCEYCGRQIGDEEKFCPNCGQPVPVSHQAPQSIPQPIQQKSKVKKNFFSDYKLKNIELPAAEKYIKHAWIAALISAAVTAVFVLLGTMENTSWADAGLLLLFAIGVYRKNKIAAIGLFVYFVISKIIQIQGAAGFNIMAIAVAVMFLHFFYLGMLGTIRHQQLAPQEKRKFGVIFGAVVGSLATVFIVFLIISALPEQANPQDVILQADYQEGYKAGYVDGRASQATLGDSYVEIATEERRGAYDIGYLKGFINGCHEGGFDCSEIEKAISEALGDTKLPEDSGVQLIPSSI